MADAPNPAGQAIAAVTAAAAAPAAQPQLPLDAAAAAPAVAAAPAPATILPVAVPAEGGAAAVAPAAPPTAEQPKIELTSEKPSLLEKHDATAAEKTKSAEPAKAADGDKKATEAAKPGEPVKPADEAAKPAEAAKAAEAAKPAEPAKPAPVEYKYKLPETLKMDDTLKSEVHGAFDAFRADPTNAQPLIDLHYRTMENYAKQLAEQTLANQHRAFNATRDQWGKEVLSNSEIGGAGHQTAMTAIARARDLLVSNAKPGTPQYLADYKAHEDFLRITGAGDHPVYLKMLHRAARYFDEPTPPGENPKPPPDNGKAPGRSARVLYDNPRSNVNRQ